MPGALVSGKIPSPRGEKISIFEANVHNVSSFGIVTSAWENVKFLESVLFNVLITRM